MGHKLYKCKGNCEYGCQFCDGGLGACSVCGAIEGSLTQDCPGVEVSKERQQQVYKQGWDYVEGLGWHQNTIPVGERIINWEKK